MSHSTLCLARIPAKTFVDLKCVPFERRLLCFYDPIPPPPSSSSLEKSEEVELITTEPNNNEPLEETVQRNHNEYRPILSTIVEVVPNFEHENDNHHRAATIRLHPVLEEFMVLSTDCIRSTMTNDEVDERNTQRISHGLDDGDTHDGATATPNALSEPSMVIQRPSMEDSTIPPCTDDIVSACNDNEGVGPFVLRRLEHCVDLASRDVDPRYRNTGVSLILRFVHGSDEGYHRYFSSIASSTDGSERNDDDDGGGGTSNHNGDDNGYLYDIVRQNLEYRFVKTGSILAVDLPSFRGGVVRAKISKEMGVAFFMVEGVETRSAPNDDGVPMDTGQELEQEQEQEQEQGVYYRTSGWENLSFRILSHATDNDNHDHRDEIDQPTSGNIQRLSNTTCPGYETLVQKIVDVANITVRAGATTALLLTGCAGVGKSRLASSIVHELIKHSPHTCTTNIVSATDVLLRASSSTDPSVLKRLLYLPPPPPSVPAVSVVNHRSILVIDDLDALFPPDDGGSESFESFTSSDYERVASFNAVLSAVDDVVASSSSIEHDDGGENGDRCVYLPFILGLCRRDRRRIPPGVERVGRFEKVMVVPPPNDGQRRRILEHLLSSLPLPPPIEQRQVVGGEGDATRQHTQRKPNQTTARMWATALAPRTAGCVAADLKRVCLDAQTRAVARSLRYGTRGFSGMEERSADVVISWNDAKEAVRACVPSQLAQLDVTVSRAVVFDDDDKEGDVVRNDANVPSFAVREKRIFDHSFRVFGGYGSMKADVYRRVIRPWKRRLVGTDEESGDCRSALEKTVAPPKGVLFHGPSGTGKTFAAECISVALGMNVVKVGVTDVLDKWLGGSEAILRSLFSRARSAAPCILFFDDIDALATNRESESESAATDVHSRLLSTLLNEMDGVSSSPSSSSSEGGVATENTVLVLATTNRIHAIDAALLRPGRLEEHFFLDHPTVEDVRDMLVLHLANVPVDSDLDLMETAEVLIEAGRISGADVKGVCVDACMRCVGRISTSEMEEEKIGAATVGMEDFEEAIQLWKG